MNADVPRRLAELRTFFDKAAATWDVMSRADAEKIEQILAYANIRPGERILDVGCGTGVLLPYLLRQSAPDGHVFALDLSPLMLEQCRRKHGDGDSDGRVTYVLGAAEQIPLAAETCAVVLCFSAFPHFPDKPVALAEITRVLKPGGRLLIAHADSRETVNRIHTEVGDPVGGDLLPAPHEMEQLLRGAGLADPVIIDLEDRFIAVASKAGPEGVDRTGFNCRR